MPASSVMCRVDVTANWTCPIGYSQCYGSKQCVLGWFFNDGANDCNVGTDEYDEYLGILLLLLLLLLSTSFKPKIVGGRSLFSPPPSVSLLVSLSSS